MIRVTVPPDDAIAYLSRRIGDYIGSQLAKPVVVTNMIRLAGGTSHATWSLDARADDNTVSAYVLRQDIDGGKRESNIESEFALLRALHAASQPVPQPHWVETDGWALATPFMLSTRIEGSDVRKVIARESVHAMDGLGNSLVDLMVGYHGVDHRSLGLAVPQPDRLIGDEVERWAGAIEMQMHDASPLAVAACNWLRLNIPNPPERPVLVHGDYKTNNILFDGKRHFITDWEMAHVGDPVEDIAWTMLWTTAHDLIGGLLTPEAFIARYETSTRRTVERGRLQFWQMFSLVKLTAIFMSSASPDDTMQPVRPTYGILGRGVLALECAMAARLQQFNEGSSP